MVKAYRVADFLLYVMAQKGVSLTNLHLNKLMYFAQGYALAKNDNALFGENIEAWRYGPVVPVIYNKYKKFGRSRIKATKFNIDTFSEREIETLADVVNDLGGLSASRLVDISHSEGSPWYDVYYARKQDKTIPTDLMKKYFKQKNIKTFFQRISHLPVVERLPKKWYDPQDDAAWQTK